MRDLKRRGVYFVLRVKKYVDWSGKEGKRIHYDTNTKNGKRKKREKRGGQPGESDPCFLRKAARSTRWPGSGGGASIWQNGKVGNQKLKLGNPDGRYEDVFHRVKEGTT